MTASGNNRAAALSFVLGMAVALHPAADLRAQELVLELHADPVGAGPVPARPLSIELSRWSTEAERTPLLAALQAPRTEAPPPAAAGGRAGRGGRGGRGGGRGGRGRGGAPETPLARLTAAVKAAPTVGFIWSDGITGYSIKYAWRQPAHGGGERIVLVTDRRLFAHDPGAALASGVAAEAEFTLIEIRIDATGAGEGKTSLATSVIVDAAAGTLALDGYSSAPVLLKVTR